MIAIVLGTPFIYSGDIYNGVITAKQIWFYCAMALLILIFGSGLINRKSVLLELNSIDIALIVFYAYFLIRAVYTPFTPLLYNVRFLNYSLLLLFYFIVKNIGTSYYSKESGENKKKILFYEIIIDILIITGLVQAIWGLLQLYGVLPSLHSIFKITGTFSNPAPYAIYLATIFLLTLGRLLLTPSSSFSKSSHYISFLTIIVIILILPATMNRASWVGVAVGSFIVLNYRYDFFRKIRKILNNMAKKLLALTFVVLIVGLSCTGLYLLKKGSSDGRLLIWEVTLGKIAEKPLFGYGVGRFEAEYNNWQADFFKSHPDEIDGSKGLVAGNTMYCFNEYLEMTSELGIIGLLLFLAIILYSLKETHKKATIIAPKDDKKRTDKELIAIINILVPSFIALLVMALISIPFYSLPTFIVYFLILALISSSVGSIKYKKLKVSQFVGSIAKFGSVIIIFSASLLLMLKVRQQIITFKIWDNAIHMYQAGYIKEARKSYSDIYISLRYNGSFLQYFGKALNIAEEYPQSIEILEQALKFTSDEVLFTTLGDNYKALERYSDAEKAYQYAFLMAPNKLYPLYLLTNLYFDSGQYQKAIKIAEKALNKNIKVESTAINEMLQAMNEIIIKIKNEEEVF
ncbi:MAG TPA: hypothetical protein GXZ49_04280 [Bacteroidetes bacterium]|nr:hypothetical protein [Bacteroidota bacterium]